MIWKFKNSGKLTKIVRTENLEKLLKHHQAILLMSYDNGKLSIESSQNTDHSRTSNN